MVPGPNLFTTQLSQTYALFLALMVGNIFIFAVGLSMVTKFSIITKIDSNYIIPIIMVLATLGALTLRANWWDVWTIVVLGFIGYYMRRNNYSVIAFVLGFVLGPIAEQNLLRSLQLSGGSFSIFVQKPLSLLLVIAIVVVLAGPYVGPRIKELVDRG
jgi:putative tricarboxylic transport membrane protein